MARKLASIQKITKITPIAGADSIEVAHVLGWECVVKKGEFGVGDLIVYFEVDSQLPERPEFEFLRTRKFRIKTVNFNRFNQVSQGLVMPLSVLDYVKVPVLKRVGTDVTARLGVTKYDPEGELEKELYSKPKNPVVKFMMRFKWFRKLFDKKTEAWPSFIKKTDEDRIQLFPDVCEREKDTVFEVTEKLDGQSATFFLKRKKFGFEFGVCSRNVHLKTPVRGNYWSTARKYEIEKFLKKIIGGNAWVYIQGEILAPDVQKNKYGMKDLEFRVFNVVTPEGKMNGAEMSTLLLTSGLKLVPNLGRTKLPETISECVEMSKGYSAIADTLREGLVLRNYEKGISFKVINPDFLLKWNI